MQKKAPSIESGILPPPSTDLMYIQESAGPQQSEKGITINGTVRDMQQEPLIGVSVMIQGTSTGAITDVDGRYIITVPNKESVLEFSYLGFETVAITVRNQININVNMRETTNSLDESVVVAYGQQKRASIVGSITSVSPTALQQGTTRAVSNNLAGQLAGVIAVQRSGEPGYDGSSFWIRGISSFQGTGRDPLVLVDGIERSLDDLSAAEIESFSVLKDAAASAVYGVRGANGVILVNTKKGYLGRPKVNFHMEQSFTQPVQLPDYIGSYEYLSLMNELTTAAGNAPLYSAEAMEGYRTGSDPDLYPNVNWLDAISKDYASNTRGDLTITGGSDILRYALVASYYGENGIFDKDPRKDWGGLHLNKYNVRSNVDINVTKTTIVGISIGGYLQEIRGLAIGTDDIFNRAFETPPYVHPTQYSSGEDVRVEQRNNPWAEATQHGYSNSTSSKIESLFSVEQRLDFITKGLKAKALFSFDRYSRSYVNRSRTPIYYSPATSRDENGNLILGNPGNGQEFLDTSNGADWGNKATYFEANVSYDRTFGKHAVNGLFLYNQRDYNDGSVVPFRRMGIAGRASYTYDNRYVAEFNFGYNGSENFTKGNRFGFFPSVSAGWRLSEEPFMDNIRHIINNAKLRASYGMLGNQLGVATYPYSTISQTQSSYIIDGSLAYYLTTPAPVSASYTWEKVATTDIGIDLALLQNRLSFSADWFIRNTSDMFVEGVTLPGVYGADPPDQNAGKMRTKGWEISLSWRDDFKLFGNVFNYEVFGSLGDARSFITEYQGNDTKLLSDYYEGMEIGEIWGFRTGGLFMSDEEASQWTSAIDQTYVMREIYEQSMGEWAVARGGDVKYLDIDGDKKITDGAKTLDDHGDMEIIGNSTPRYNFGFGLNLNYFGFDFGITFQGIGKCDIYPNKEMEKFWGPWGRVNAAFLPEGIANRAWSEDNKNGYFPQLERGGSAYQDRGQMTTVNDRYLQSVAYVRLKNLSFGYTLPQKWTQKIRIERLRIYVAGDNLWYWSPFRTKYIDPEQAMASNDGRIYPFSKTFTVGVNLNF